MRILDTSLVDEVKNNSLNTIDYLIYTLIVVWNRYEEPLEIWDRAILSPDLKFSRPLMVWEFHNKQNTLNVETSSGIVVPVWYWNLQTNYQPINEILSRSEIETRVHRAWRRAQGSPKLKQLGANGFWRMNKQERLEFMSENS